MILTPRVNVKPSSRAAWNRFVELSGIKSYRKGAPANPPSTSASKLVMKDRVNER